MANIKISYQATFDKLDTRVHEEASHIRIYKKGQLVDKLAVN